MNRLGKILLVSGVLLAATAIAGVAQPHLGRSATASNPTAITVTGNGTANATPDSASFSFGVTSQASTAGGALGRSSAQARAIVAALEKAGIDAKDMQTTDVSLWPQTKANGTEIVGYTASNSVNVTAPLARAGGVVDAAVGAGANNVSGPSLSRGDRDRLYRDALEKAVADAKAKAEVLAQEAGVSVGAVQSLTESPQVSGGPMPVMYKAAAFASDTPVEAGTTSITASVRVVFKLG